MAQNLKAVLNEIVDNLEKVATQVIAMETALVVKGLLAEGEVETHAPNARFLASEHLSQARRLIKLLPNA